MVQIDVSGIATFMPVFGFLLVFIVVYALLGKTKVLGENRFVHIFTSFAVAIIFLISAHAVEYIQFITPWVAIFIVSLVAIGLLVGVVRGNIEEFFNVGFGWFIVVALIIFFLFSAIKVFGSSMAKYLPTQFMMQPQILAIIVLVAIAVFASWLLSRGK